MQKCLRRSEALVSWSFRIPALPSKQYPYEVVTSLDMEHPERAEGAFAHLVIYERGRPRGVEHLYRICLQDEVILSRLLDEKEPWLEALLVYILTHELVHVVRFQRAEQSFLVEKDLRQQEEESVHQTTLELLQSAGEPHWQRLSRLYGTPVIPAYRIDR
jgi:hypothetical protein